MKNLITLFLLIYICSSGLYSQVEFVNSGQSLEPGSFTMGFADVNGDYRDDLVIQGEDRMVHVYIQTENQDFIKAKIIDLEGSNDWSLSIFDLDNDGQKEIVTSGYYRGTQLIKFTNSVDFETIIETIEPGEIFAQNSNAIDINNDGYLDYFVCHDDGDSQMYINDGQGSFNKDVSMFDFKTTPSSDGSGNYGSIWVDIDEDDDLDLYIAKCRRFVSSNTDPRRINQLHINNGDGTFTEKAVEFGLASGEQTWAADFADVDNDGDLDCYMVEHSGDYMLYENTDSIFVPRPNYIMDPISGSGYQGFFSDLDNDGLVDIIIAGDDDYILWNKGGFNFEKDFIVIPGNRELASLALGDANLDGFTDFMTTYSIGSNVSTIPNELWINEGNDNNYVKISVEGTESNREGVGARIRVYSSLGTQLRTVTSGEGYGVVNSITQSYGLGQDNIIDSLKVTWPSGQEDTFFDLKINTHYIIHEGACITDLNMRQYEISQDGFCEGDSLLLSGNGNGWNTGDDDSTLSVSSTGFYYATFLDSLGCASPFHTLYIEEAEELQAIIAVDNNLACVGEEVVLSSGFTEGVVWSTNEEVAVLAVTETGEYFYTVQGLCKELESDTVLIQFLDPAEIDDQFIEANQGENVEINVVGENVYWYNADDLVNSFHQGNSLSVNAIQSNTQFWVQDVVGDPLVEANVGLAEIQEEMHGNNLNGGLYFNVYDNVHIKGVTINTDVLGLRNIEVRNAEGVVVQSKSIDIIQTGEQYVQLDFIITEGVNYFMSTNDQINISSFGSLSPRLFRNSDVTGFPFIATELLEITDSFFGPDYYYYFYNWEVSNVSLECSGNLAKIEIDVELSAVNDPEFLADLSIYPLPASDEIHIESKLNRIERLELYDGQGKIAISQRQSTFKSSLNISNLTPGIYVLKIISDSGKNAFVKIPCISR